MTLQVHTWCAEFFLPWRPVPSYVDIRRVCVKGIAPPKRLPAGAFPPIAPAGMQASQASVGGIQVGLLRHLNAAEQHGPCSFPNPGS